MKSKNIIVACGGTGGHAFPGLATAEVLRSRGYDVTIWNSGRTIEKTVMSSWNGATFATGAKKLSAANAFSNAAAVFRCMRAIRETKPAAMLAMGSYTSFPPVAAAWLKRVPVVLHEANAVAGKAVTFLSRFARKVAVSFEAASAGLPRAKTVCTGLPLRAGVPDGRRIEGIPEGAFCVFVTGGSQGAHAVNMLAAEALASVKRELDSREGARPLYVIHQTGRKDEGVVMASYAVAAMPAKVCAFEDRMADVVMKALRLFTVEVGDREMVVQIVRRTMSAVIRTQRQVTLRVAPELVETVRSRVEELRTAYPTVETFDVVEDPRLKGPACILETEAGVADASVETQLAAIERSLKRHIAGGREEAAKP